MSKIGVAVTVISISTLLLGLTAWLYRDVDGDQATITYNGYTSSACQSVPFKYSRPMFAREENGGLHDIYCGFSLSNTVYRWVVAGVSILYSLVMLVPGLVEKMPATHYWTVFSFAVLWFGATTADCQAIYMSYATCNSFFGGSNAAAYGMTNEFECHNARYGLAVAFDFVLSVTFLVYLSMVNPKAAA